MADDPETEESIRLLNRIVEDFVRKATAMELPVPDARMRAYVGDCTSYATRNRRT
jgi:hypothetical protein